MTCGRSEDSTWFSAATSLIYFDPETKTRVLEGIARVMPPDGLLFLGGAETVIGVTDRFKPVPGQRGIFCLNRDPASAAHPESAASGAGAR